MAARTTRHPAAGAAPATRPRSARPVRGQASAAGSGSLGERLIAGVPARVMRPRLVFLACLGALLAFGLLMVYSASSVEALKETGDSMYYLKRQALFIVIGLIVFVAISRVPLHVMRSDAVWVLWGAVLLALALVLVVGVESGGAKRWIALPFIQFQPSEFGKAVILVTAARIFYEYYEARTISTGRFLGLLAACAGAPLILIMIEPDMGTTLIILTTLVCMALFAGISWRVLGAVGILLLIAAAVAVAIAPYRIQRFLVALDPWSDPYGDGYQATLAIMAFASGGLFGRGIGNSTMKYHYLPEAHNDYILAIIGEELGFVGTLAFFIVFATMIVAAFKIAWQSPSLQGRLIASGSAVLISIQFLINALGILGVTPMTGKTLPFISYGGSSMVASLILASLVLRVSIESNPKTVYDARRDDFAVVDESTAGEVRVRSGRGGFSVVDGAAAAPPRRRPDERLRRDAGSPRDAGAPVRDTARGMDDARGRDASSGTMRPPRREAGFQPARGSGSSRGRINLAGDARDRLRRDGDGPRVGYDRGGYAPDNNRSRRRDGRGRYDR